MCVWERAKKQKKSTSEISEEEEEKRDSFFLLAIGSRLFPLTRQDNTLLESTLTIFSSLILAKSQALMLLVRSLTSALEALRSSPLPPRARPVAKVNYIRGERVVLSSQPARYFLRHRPRVVGPEQRVGGEEDGLLTTCNVLSKISRAAKLLNCFLASSNFQLVDRLRKHCALRVVRFLVWPISPLLLTMYAASCYR